MVVWVAAAWARRPVGRVAARVAAGWVEVWWAAVWAHRRVGRAEARVVTAATAAVGVLREARDATVE